LSAGLFIVGIGPGGHAETSFHADQVLRRADRIVGYQGYIDQVRTWLPDARFIPSPIGAELERASNAIDLALRGEQVALIGSGDAGVYGLAGLVLELLQERDADELPVEVVPGITAATAAAALLGAPLGHDFAVISLSDILTPWSVIRRRLEAAARADFVTVLYNPASQRRRRQLELARGIFLRFRASETPVGQVDSAYREGQRVSLSTLGSFEPLGAGMLSTLVIGNSSTRRWGDRLITPRGYRATELSRSADSRAAPEISPPR
jgi:precorrin-3B C17-methyltransferase